MLFKERLPVNALRIGLERRFFKQVVLQHFFRVLMASRAGPRNIQTVHGRAGVMNVNDVVMLSVTSLAGSRGSALLQGNPVVGAEIDLGFLAVTGAAVDGL